MYQQYLNQLNKDQKPMGNYQQSPSKQQRKKNQKVDKIDNKINQANTKLNQQKNIQIDHERQIQSNQLIQKDKIQQKKLLKDSSNYQIFKYGCFQFQIPAYLKNQVKETLLILKSLYQSHKDHCNYSRKNSFVNEIQTDNLEEQLSLSMVNSIQSGNWQKILQYLVKYGGRSIQICGRPYKLQVKEFVHKICATQIKNVQKLVLSNVKLNSIQFLSYIDTPDLKQVYIECQYISSVRSLNKVKLQSLQYLRLADLNIKELRYQRIYLSKQSKPNKIAFTIQNNSTNHIIMSILNIAKLYQFHEQLYNQQILNMILLFFRNIKVKTDYSSSLYSSYGLDNLCLEKQYPALVKFLDKFKKTRQLILRKRQIKLRQRQRQAELQRQRQQRSRLLIQRLLNGGI